MSNESNHTLTLEGKNIVDGVLALLVRIGAEDEAILAEIEKLFFEFWEEHVTPDAIFPALDKAKRNALAVALRVYIRRRLERVRT